MTSEVMIIVQPELQRLAHAPRFKASANLESLFIAALYFVKKV
jgi:hypothetical protein